VPDVRRISPAAVSLLQRIQEVGAPEPLYGGVRGPEVHELRRSRAGQVPQLLRKMGPLPIFLYVVLFFVSISKRFFFAQFL